MSLYTFGLDLDGAILGGLITEGRFPKEAGWLTGDLFAPRLQKIASAVISVGKRTGTCDLISVKEEMDRDGCGVDDLAELFRIAEVVVSPTHLPGHLKLLRERAELDQEESEGPRTLTLPDIVWRGIFNTYREAMQGTTEACDVAHFAALWGAVAARLGRRLWIHYGFPHYANAYLLVYGPTGDKKTTAARRSLELMSEDGTVKILRGVGSGEGLADWLSPPADGPRPVHFLFLEEFAELLSRGRWEGATLLSFLTHVFDCPDRYELKFRKNPITVPEPTLSLLACTTPEWLWQGLRTVDIAGGFGNRVLYLTGERKAPIPMPARPDRKKLTRVKGVLDRLATVPPQEVALSPQANDLWSEFYTAWGRTEWEPLVKAAIERVPAYVLKLGMIYAVLEESLPTITPDQLVAAIAVGEYAARCADRLIALHERHTEEGRVEEAIRRFLRERDHAKRELKHRLGGRVRATLFNRVLEAMVRSGEIVERSGSRQGQTILSLAGRRRG